MIRALTLMIALGAAPAHAGGWTVEIASDPMDDKTQAQAIAGSPDGHVALAMGCNSADRSLVAFVQSLNMLDSEYKSGSSYAVVRYRADATKPAQSATLKVSDDRKAVWAFGTLLGWLDAATSPTTLLELGLYRGGRQVYTIDTTGYAEARKQIETACGITTQQGD